MDKGKESIHHHCDVYTEMEVDKVRFRAVRVLEKELPEIRLYLQRDNPNIEDALAKVEILERLALELKSPRR
jgi:hypothetical protein